MSRARGTRRTCPAGHVYHKTSDCLVCPRCESARRPTSGFLATLVAPARRALEREGIVTLVDLAARSEAELLALHGVGPTTLPKLRAVLTAAGLRFRD